MSVFKTQTLFDLFLDTGIDITSATTTEIEYKKPGGTTGAWTATVDSTTKLKYSITTGDLDEAGAWSFQSKVTIGGRTAYGDIKKLDIKERLTAL